MVTWQPNNHLDTCSAECKVRHCSCGAPAVLGMWSCGRTLACKDARNEHRLRRISLLNRLRGGRR